MKSTYLLLSLLLHLSWSEEVCRTINSCSCESPRGLIDLSPLAMHTGNPRFLDIHGEVDDFEYSWNGCGNFSEGLSVSQKCLGVAACQHDIQFPSKYYSLGTQNSAIFYYDGNGDLILKYTARGQFIAERQTFITLRCDKQETGRLSVFGEVGHLSGVYHMTLTSKYACPTGGTTPVPTTTVDPDLYPKRETFLLTAILCCVFAILIGVCALIVAYLTSRLRSQSAKDVLRIMDDEKLLE